MPSFALGKETEQEGRFLRKSVRFRNMHKNESFRFVQYAKSIFASLLFSIRSVVSPQNARTF